MDSLEKYMPEILQKIKKGRAVLFLGAGASASAGAPLEKELVEAIKEKFPKLDRNLNTLLEVCQDYEDVKGYNIQDLEEFITQRLSRLQPSEAHISLAKYNWPVIFTTNFDDLIETAYRIAKNPLKPCFTVSYPQESPVIDHSKVYLFKLMGTLMTRSENKMVLCRSDYNDMIKKRPEYLEDLTDYVKDGTIVFIGYKGSDRIALDIIHEVIRKIGLQRLPWSYVLLKGGSLSEKEEYRFQSHKMIPVSCSFEEFFEYLDKNPPEAISTPEIPQQGVRIRIEGKDVVLSYRELENFGDYFEILNEDLLASKPANKDDFFKGLTSDYGYYSEGVDFIREVYTKPTIQSGKTIKKGLRDRIVEELQKTDLAENRIILVKGVPGVGKSVLLRRLAYDIYTSGKAPVIVLDKTRMFFDLKLLSSILVTLDRRFDEASGPEEGHRLKSLIVVDDLAADPFMIKDYLTSRNRHATIVVAVRENEVPDLQANIPDVDTYRIDERLSKTEKTDIIQYLFKQGYVQTLDENWDLMLDEEFENSFFATIYTLVLHARKPLNEIIRSQYSRLPAKSQKAFAYICAFHQFNLPLNIELLVRALKIDYEQFYDGIIPDAKGLIFEELSRGFLLYASHHRIIASKTIEFFFGFSNMQKNLFLEVLSDVNLRNSMERELIQKLMVIHLSSRSQSTDLSPSDRIEIFKKVCGQHETKALLHHLGVLLADVGQFLEAERTLKRSLATKEIGRAPFRSELDQNILTSLGTLYSRMAITNFTKEDPELAQEKMRLAESCFLKARFGGFPNAHSYHAHANMYLQIGDMQSDNLQKINSYSTALDILEEARDNLNEDQFQLIYELETMIYSRIGNIQKSLEIATTLAQKYNSARGYTLLAGAILKDSSKFTVWPDREPLVKKAMAIVEEGLEAFPKDEYCLRLQARLVRQLHPLDDKLYFDSLQDWYNTARSPNLRLLFELAVTAFKLKQYQFSRQIFEKLENERISGGIRNRYREYMYADPRGKPLDFVGVIVSIESRYDGNIRCETLNELPYPLHFRPIACRSQVAEGDMVQFNIVFDFLGPRAIRVERI